MIHSQQERPFMKTKHLLVFFWTFEVKNVFEIRVSCEKSGNAAFLSIILKKIISVLFVVSRFLVPLYPISSCSSCIMNHLLSIIIARYDWLINRRVLLFFKIFRSPLLISSRFGFSFFFSQSVSQSLGIYSGHWFCMGLELIESYWVAEQPCTICNSHSCPFVRSFVVVMKISVVVGISLRFF